MALDFFLQLRIRSEGLTYKWTTEWYPTSMIIVISDKSSLGDTTSSQTTKNRYSFEIAHFKLNSLLSVSTSYYNSFPGRTIAVVERERMECGFPTDIELTGDK